ncbi:MAG: helix-turn-helix transcriptional regulator [Candidatus Limnocylindrales bacterium]
MGRVSRTASQIPRRATAAAAANRHATELARKLGAALRDARRQAGLTQAAAGAPAGLSQATWSSLEVDRDAHYTMATWDRAAFAVGGTLEAFVRGASAADQPRDAVHLKGQELIIRTAKPGLWAPLPEELIDREARTSRAADVLLHRRRPTNHAEYALMELIDWFDDVEARLVSGAGALTPSIAMQSRACDRTTRCPERLAVGSSAPLSATAASSPIT